MHHQQQQQQQQGIEYLDLERAAMEGEVWSAPSPWQCDANGDSLLRNDNSNLSVFVGYIYIYTVIGIISYKPFL